MYKSSNRKVAFHGAFSDKVAALRKVRSIGHNAFIRTVKLRDGNYRYVVLTKRG